ncbi:hypothetical protein [Nocardioides sp. 1609]|uniref:hypothetical protein n=1 Tax=Nocardioides sp. 1609 TaxID=2508327 RepID=UPI00106F5BD5|nr:hypothetical protein [Nocardioides sp. 1609]
MKHVALTAAVALLVLTGCRTVDDNPDNEPTAEAPVFTSAAELLEAAKAAGLTVCPDPAEPTNASRASDQLWCGLTNYLIAARIFEDAVDQAYDIDGQRELAFFDLKDGREPSSIAYSPNDAGQPFWMIVGPLDEVRDVADALGGEVMDLTNPDNALAPGEQLACRWPRLRSRHAHGEPRRALLGAERAVTTAATTLAVLRRAHRLEVRVDRRPAARPARSVTVRREACCSPRAWTRPRGGARSPTGPDTSCAARLRQRTARAKSC